MSSHVNIFMFAIGILEWTMINLKFLIFNSSWIFGGLLPCYSRSAKLRNYYFQQENVQSTFLMLLQLVC